MLVVISDSHSHWMEIVLVSGGVVCAFAGFLYPSSSTPDESRNAISREYWCGVESHLFERLENLAEKCACREKHNKWCLEQTQLLATQVKTKLQNDEKECKD